MKFSNKIQTALRLLIVGLLIYPFPVAMAVEQTETESFNENGTNQTDLVFDYSYDDNRNICWNRLDTYSGQYGTTGQSLNYNTCNHSMAVLRMTFPDDNISSAGFNLGAADYTWYVTWNYTDGTSSSKTSYNAHNDGYETVSHTAPTDKYIETVDVEAYDYVLLDDITWTYDDGVTAGTGAPTNLTVSANLHNGSITIDWDAPANTYQHSPERYAIGFDKADPPSYAVASGNVGDSNALDTEYTFTKSYLQSALDAQVGDTLYFKIRSDNDTNSSYSSWTTIASYTIQDVASGPSEFSIQNTSYQGLQFSWTATDTGWSLLDYYKISYKLSSEETYTDIQITDTTATSYTIEDISAGTYDFNLYACTDSGFCHGSQAGPANNYVVNENTATTTTTIVYTLGPPINPVVTQEYNVGVNVDWDEPNTGNATATSYELYYRTSAEDEIKIENITETEYTIPYANIPNGTYEFSIRAIDSVNNVNSGYSTEPTLEVFNQKAKDDADAQAEADRKAREKAEAEERERKEREEREAREKAERIAREKAIQDEKDKNFSETGYYELNSERSDREQKEYEAEQERLRLEEEARLKAIQDEKDSNFAETGYYELDSERTAREDAEEEARIQKELEESVLKDVDTKNLTEEEKAEVKELVDTIQRLQEELEIIEIEEEVFEIKEIVIVTTTTTTTTTIPIIEDFSDEEDEPAEQVEDKPLPSEEGDSEVQLTREEVEVLVNEVEEAITEVVQVEEIPVEIIEEEVLETLSEVEVEEYIEAVEEAVAEVVAELETEELVEVVEQVAEVDVQNLATADVQTKAVVKAVVQEVTKVETVAELDEEEKQAVGEVLGFKEETAAEDVEIIAEQAAKEEVVAEAVEEYVDRAIENKDIEDYTLADVVTEVQVEVFLENPVGALIDVNITEMDLGSLGNDMTSDQRQKSKEVVVPVIIASQIISQAGALMTRRF